MNNPQTFLFLGRSGAGKGTQAKLLREYIEKKTGENAVFFDMGGAFREFFKREEFIPSKAHDVSMAQGKFQPDFITNALFINEMFKIKDSNCTMFIDGFPRSISQLAIVKDLLTYLNRENPTFINVVVSKENVVQRMLARGRGDDTKEAIESRVGEYDRAVVPMIEELKKDNYFKYIEVDGEPDIQTIHKNLISVLEL